MPRPELASEQLINEALSYLPYWNREGNLIIRELSLSNFVACVGLVNSIAILAEKNDHHPDIQIYAWNKLRITLSTHDRGGLTELDFKLATDIETLIK
jgi:4a-hydroxytetrahydrobiopterin dehydratase